MINSKYKNNLNLIFDKLLKTYSYQGWWPFIGYDGVNPTKTGAISGYHPKDYDFPKDTNQKFEIVIGSILTQNTTWPSVEQALNNLNKLVDFDPLSILEFANNNYQFAESDLIYYYIYEIKANQAKLNYLIKMAKNNKEFIKGEK